MSKRLSEIAFRNKINIPKWNRNDLS